MNKLLEKYYLPKSAQEERENLNTSTFIKEIECVIKNLPGPDGFTGVVYQTCKEEIIPT